MKRLLLCAFFLVSSTTSQAFISKIRATDGTKIPCHQVSAAYRAYVEGALTAAQALTRVELLCGCTIAGQDLTDLSNFRNVIDAIGILEIGSTAGENSTEVEIQRLRKLARVSAMESYCGIFELNNDVLLNETQLRTLLGIQ